MTPDDLPRLESRYATIRLGPHTAAVIELTHSGRTGDGPYIGHYRIVQRVHDPDGYGMVATAQDCARLYAERER